MSNRVDHDYDVFFNSFYTFQSLHTALKVITLVVLLFVLERVFKTVILRSKIGPVSSRENLKAFCLLTVRLVIFGLGLISVLEILGIAITPFIASLGIGSLALALALQDTLGNLFSGLYILIDQPIRIGDFVKLETSGDEGYVQKIGWRSTQIRMLSNNILMIPNSKLSSIRITNFSLPDPETAVLLDMAVSWDSDLDRIEELIVQVAKETMETVPGAVSDFIPFIRYSELGTPIGTPTIKFTVIMRAHHFVDNYLIKHEFIKRVHQACKSSGIDPSRPQFILHSKPH